MQSKRYTTKLNVEPYLLLVVVMFAVMFGCSKSEDERKDREDLKTLYNTAVAPIEVSEPVRTSLKELLELALSFDFKKEYKDSLLSGFKLSSEMQTFLTGNEMTGIWDYDKFLVTHAYAVDRNYERVIMFATPLFLEHKSMQASLHSMLGAMYYELAILDMLNRNLYGQTKLGYLTFYPDKRTLDIMRAAKIEINEGARVDSSTFRGKIKTQINTHISNVYTESSIKLDQGVAARWLISLVSKKPELHTSLEAVIQAFRWDEAFYKLPPPLDPLAATAREKHFKKIDSLQIDLGFRIKGLCALASLLSSWTDAMTFYMLFLDSGGRDKDIAWLKQTLTQDGELIKKYLDLLDIRFPSDVRKTLTLRQLNRESFLKIFQTIENEIIAKFPKPHGQLFLLIFWENSAITHLNTMPERIGYSAFESAQSPLSALINISKQVRVDSRITKRLSILLSRTYYPLLTTQSGHEMAIELVQICDVIFSVLVLELKNQSYPFKSRRKSSSRRRNKYHPLYSQKERSLELRASEYFPVKVGTKWVYSIEVGEIEPLAYRVTSWPIGDKVTAIATSGLPGLFQKTKKKYTLVMKIKSQAPRQGPFQYSNGLTIDIENDDLGIFEYHKQVFWAIHSEDRFMVWEIITYSPEIPPTPKGGPSGSWAREDGYSMRLVFFTDKPGIQLGFGREPSEFLQFVGIDTQVPQYEGNNCLHFVRKIKADKLERREISHLDKEFTEDMWFAKGKGLVRLIQQIDGKISMTWQLVQFAEENN